MKNAMLVASVTRQGAGHAKTRRPNEDSVHFEVLPNGRGVVAAVSDGAGSAPRAQHGSRLATLCAVQGTVKAIYDDEALACAVQAGMEAAREAIRLRAKIFGAEMSDYHCTLILVAWIDDEVAAIQVGDGAAIVESDGSMQNAHRPAAGRVRQRNVLPDRAPLPADQVHPGSQGHHRRGPLHGRPTERGNRLPAP